MVPPVLTQLKLVVLQIYSLCGSKNFPYLSLWEDCVWARESTAPAQGNQSLSRELRASALCPGLKPSSQHAGEKRGVAGLLLGRTERAARAAELQLCAQAR